MKRHGLHSPRLAELKRARRRGLQNKILLIILALAMVITGLAFLSRINKLNINAVEVVGSKVVDQDLIKEAVNEDLAGNYLWFFPKKNIFIYPKQKTFDDLTEKWKRLKNISSNITNDGVLQISVDERQGLYIWCGAMPGKSDSGCYYIDSDGYIFDEAPYFSGEVYFKFYGGISDSENPVGNYIAKDNFAKLLTFKDTLDKIGLKPTSIYLGGSGEVKVYLLPTRGSNSPEIMFKLADDLENLAGNLQTALNTDPLQMDFQKKYSSLIYIDLRFGNKVYYKFR